MRDAGGMGAHRITYEGPASLAVHVATMLAEADGIELRSSEAPVRRDGPDDPVVLAVTVEASDDDVRSALAKLRIELPPGASIDSSSSSA
jgi:hypothetical protein